MERDRRPRQAARLSRDVSVPWTVVGAGRVGSVLARRAGTRTLRRDDVEAPRSDGPVVVATRNDDLDAVLTRLDPAVWPRVVLVQNGVLDPVLRRIGLSAAGVPDNGPLVTLGLLYFAASARDGLAVPGGTSWFCGPEAANMVAAFTELGLPAGQLGPADHRAATGVKLSWNLIYGLLGELEWRAGRPNLVAAVTEARRADCVALCSELRPVLTAWLGADPGPLVADLFAYSARIPDFPVRLRELSWRNGALAAEAARAGLPTPLHDALLARATS